MREAKFTSYNKYLEDITKINITFDEHSYLKDIPFCYKYVNFINPTKKHANEKYLIFTSAFQIKLLKKVKQIYIDGTFQICPKNYYQVINIAGYLEDINAIVPIFLIPTTGKTEYLYNHIFNDIKLILKDANYNLEDVTKYFMLDFEVGLQKAIKLNFPNALISGCFFHFVKCLWEKAKKLYLCKKDKIKHTKILIFALKIIPFIDIDHRTEFFKKIEDFYSSFKNDNNYNKLKQY